MPRCSTFLPPRRRRRKTPQLSRLKSKNKGRSWRPGLSSIDSLQSEIEFAAELHLAAFVSTVGLAKGPVCDAAVDRVEVGVVENVECLSAHLEVDVFAE